MIYFDHAATTPLHPSVIEAMEPFLHKEFGNASSIHGRGRIARAALEKSREVIAAHLQVNPREIIFTGSGTESDNTALIGVALAKQAQGKHIITTQIEHHAVLNTCHFLEQLGFEVTYLPVDEQGRVLLDDLKKAVRDDTILVSIIYGNNEVGTIQDIEAIGSYLREKGIMFHSDGVQVLGVLSLDLSTLPVDLMSFSAHKINGPKGVGALYIAQGTPFIPYLHGGAQERNRRAGTENVAGIVGFAKSVELVMESREEKIEANKSFKKLMLKQFDKGGIAYNVNGDMDHALPHILNVSFPGLHTETLIMKLDLAGIAVASGSACSSGSLEPSHVLKAMKLNDKYLKSALRFSFGIGNNEEEVLRGAEKVVEIVSRGQIRG